MVFWSIIIPAFNEENYLGKVLYSCERAVEGEDAEIIVVANGCTDGTVKVAKGFKKVKVIETDKKGISRAKNLGASKAKGKVLIFLDADTMIAKNALPTIKKALGKADFGSLWVLPYPSTFKSRFFMTLKNYIYSFGFWKGTNGIIFCKRTIFDAVGGFKEKLKKQEDKEFIYSSCKHGMYKYVNESFVKTSMRRYQYKGYLWVIWYWISVWMKEKLGRNNTDYPVFR